MIHRIAQMSRLPGTLLRLQEKCRQCFHWWTTLVEVHFKNAQFLYDAIYSYKHTVRTIRSISLFVPKYPIEQWSSYLGRASILL